MAISNALEREKMKVIVCSGLLLFMPLCVLLYNSIPEYTKYQIPFITDSGDFYTLSLSPQKPVYYSLRWMLSIGNDRVIAIIYIICAYIKPDFGKCLKVNLWVFYGIYELTRIASHWLTLEQVPYNDYYAYLLIIYTTLYAITYVYKND